MAFTTKNQVGFSLHLCKCGWDFLVLLFYFPRPPVKEKGKSICLLLEFPISDSLNLKRDSAASYLSVVSAESCFFFHSGSLCGQTHLSQEYYRTKGTQNTDLLKGAHLAHFRLWVLWNVSLCIWYIQNQPSSARSFRLVWQLETPIVPSPDHICSRQRGLLSSCDSTWILAQLLYHCYFWKV